MKRKLFLGVVYLYIYLLRNSLFVVLLQCLWYNVRHFNNREIMTGLILN